MNFFSLLLTPISPGSNNVLMFTRLVLTNSDLLHLVTSTLDLEHREIEMMVMLGTMATGDNDKLMEPMK